MGTATPLFRMITHRRLRRLLLLTAFGLFATNAIQPTVSAAPPPADTPVGQPVGSGTWFFDDGEREIDGLDRTARLDVTIPPGWAVSGPARLDVSYVLGSNASGLMSVSVNGAYIDDVLLGRSIPSHTLEIPADTFVSGANVVELAAAVDLVIDRECRDPSHPARRLDLGSDTMLTLPLAPTGRAELADFPAVMEPIGMTDRIVDVHILGPASNDTLSAAGDLISALRVHANHPIGLDVQIHRPSAFTSDLIDPQRPSVVVGLTEDARVAPALADRTNDEDVSLVHGQRGYPVLIVTGGDGAALDEATERLVVRNLFDEPDRARRFTLLDLAYESRALEGPGRDSTVYAFDVPIGAVPAGGTISVVARRSTGAAGLDGVGVILNGQRLGVAPFDKRGRTEDDPLEIPGDALRPGRNLLRLDADFREEPEGCLTGERDQSVEIEATTLIELGDPDGHIELDLDDLPFTFRHIDDSETLTIVLPVSPTSEEVADAVDLAGLMGSATRPGRIAIGDQLDDTAYESHHLVVLGVPSRQPALARLTGAANVDGDGAPPAPPEGTIRFVVREDAPDRLVLVMSGTDDVQARTAVAAVLSVETRGVMTGGAVVVVSGGEATDVSQTAQPVLIEVGGDESEADEVIELAAEDSGGAVDEGSIASTTTPTTIAEATSTPIEGVDGGSILSGYGFEVVVTLLLGAATLLIIGGVHISRRRQASSD